MAISDERWSKARAMFEGGASLSDIGRDTNIDRSTISKKAKLHGWQKSINQQLIIDDARTAFKKSHLNQHQRDFHDRQFDKQIEKERISNRLDTSIDLAINVANQHLNSGEATMQDVASFAKAQNDFRIGLETQDKFAKSGNVNVQQNQGGNSSKSDAQAAKEWLDSIVDEPKTAEEIKYQELHGKVKAIFNIPEPEIIEDAEKWLESIVEGKCPVDEFAEIIEEGILSCEGLAEQLAEIRDNQENSNAPVTEEEIIRLKEIVDQDRKSLGLE